MSYRRGFTIVELLIVIVVIGILAGITFFSFQSWRSQVAVTEMQNELVNAASSAKMYRNVNGVFPSSLSMMSYSSSANVSLTYTLRADTLSYCMKAASTAVASAAPYYIDTNVSINPTTTACS
jgi:type IV pilus assembly protein PilE